MVYYLIHIKNTKYTSNKKIINDDVFIMPEKDITIRGIWTKISMEKRMDGTGGPDLA